MPDSIDSPGRPDPVPWKSLHMRDWAKLDDLSQETRGRVLNELEKEGAHRRRLRWADRALYAFGLLMGGASAGAYVWAAVYFVNHHAATQGAAILSGGAATMVGLFLGSRFSKRSQKGD
jgi:hypothetical protein